MTRIGFMMVVAATFAILSGTVRAPGADALPVGKANASKRLRELVWQKGKKYRESDAGPLKLYASVELRNGEFDYIIIASETHEGLRMMFRKVTKASGELFLVCVMDEKLTGAIGKPEVEFNIQKERDYARTQQGTFTDAENELLPFWQRQFTLAVEYSLEELGRAKSPALASVESKGN